MKRLVFKDCQYNKNIEEPECILLIIENKQYLFSFINRLLSENEDLPIKVIDENEKELKLVEYVEVVTSIFNLDFNKKQNITALVKLIKNLNQEILSTSKVNIEKHISALTKSINLENDVQICTDINISVDDIIKLMNLKIYPKTNLLKEYLFEYIKVVFELRKIKIFVFYSLLNWLEEKDLKELVKNCIYLGLTIIDIEHTNKYCNMFDKKFLLDKDLCLIKKLI